MIMKKSIRSFSVCLFLVLIFYLPSWAQNNTPVLDAIGSQNEFRYRNRGSSPLKNYEKDKVKCLIDLTIERVG